MPYQSNPFFDDQEQAPAGALELALKKRLLARQALAQRNVAAVGPQGPQGLGGIDQASMARRRMQDYQRFGAGGNGVVLRQPPAQAPVPPVPQEPNPMAGMVAQGRPGGVSEVSGGLDPAMRQRLQAAFAARAQREAALHAMKGKEGGKAVEGLSQGDVARRRADFLAANGGRPSTAKNNSARLEAKLAMMNRLNMMEAAPQLAALSIQHQPNDQQKATALAYHASALETLRNALGNDHPLVKRHIAMMEGMMGGPASPPQSSMPGAPYKNPMSDNGIEGADRIEEAAGQQPLIQPARIAIGKKGKKVFGNPYGPSF